MKGKLTFSRREWLERVVLTAAASVAGGAVLSACGNNDKDKGESSANGVVAPTAAKIHCVDCGHCMPCEFGVDIPGVFLFYNRAIDERFLPDSDVTIAHARHFLSEYDSTIADVAQAHRCITCYHCAGKCPQNIFIAREMEKITMLTESLRNRICQDE